MTRAASYSFFRHPAANYESERCGASRGVFYANFLPALVRAHQACFKGWELRIHHDDRVREQGYFRVLEEMARRGMLRLVPMGAAETLCGAMLWRMKPLWDDAVTHVICRDIDSLPSVRERKAVDKWEAAQKFVSALHDSVSHNGTQLMGGMIGFFRKSPAIVAQHVAPTWGQFLARMALSGVDFNRHGADQLFLNRLGIAQEHIVNESRETIGPPADPRDICDGEARHIGGAFASDKVRRWYDSHVSDYPEIIPILEAERDCGWGVKP